MMDDLKRSCKSGFNRKVSLNFEIYFKESKCRKYKSSDIQCL